MDVDGDGDADLLAGNKGLNHLFDVSPQQPVSIYSYDFDENGQAESIITHYLDGAPWPLPRKEILGQIVPSLNKKYLSFTDYGAASLDDLFERKKIDKADRYQVTETRSGVFFNENGSFSFSPFPDQLQTFPIYDFAYFDGMWVAAGNFTFNEVELGPQDGGRGVAFRFQETEPEILNHSLPFLTGEIRFLEAMPLGNKPILLIGTNNERLKAVAIQHERN
jgi:hypothetical protein